MHFKAVSFGIVLCLAISAAPACRSRSPQGLPPDFLSLVSGRFDHVERIEGGAGGASNRGAAGALQHYPVIMIHANARGRSDWTGRGGVYERCIARGFSPAELWMYEYARKGVQMRNIEELTDGLRAFIYSVMWYTRSSKVQILAHGEGAVLAAATLKKYHLYNLVHAVAYLGGPFRSSSLYHHTAALRGYPVHANLAPGSDFLRELHLPDETPYNIEEGENLGNFAVKYMTVRSRNDEFFCNDPDSPMLDGAHNVELEGLDHDGIRTAKAATDCFIPFLGDPAIPFREEHDADGDGFMCEEHGGPDRDDRDPSIYPGAREIHGDNIDQDCNYHDRAPWGGKDVEVPIR